MIQKKDGEYTLKRRRRSFPESAIDACCICIMKDNAFDIELGFSMI